MAKVIKIDQNPQRYNRRGNGWQVSAADNIQPLQIGSDSPSISAPLATTAVTSIPSSPLPEYNVPVLPKDKFEVSPDFLVEGIVIRIEDGENGVTHLVSPKTLEAIELSANPHYNIETTGIIRVKGRDIPMGKSVRTITINVEKLKDRGEELDIKNKKAAVGFVDYVYEGPKAKSSTLPLNLINQINYTLIGDISRPKDKFGVNVLSLGDDETVYNLVNLNTQTRQSDGTLDKNKLQKALSELESRRRIMEEDFNMIKDVFYNGTFPESQLTSDFEVQANTVSEEEDFPVVFKYSRILEVKDTPNTTPPPSTTGGAGTTPGGTSTTPTTDPPPAGTPAATTPPIIQFRMRKKRDLRRNTIGVFENDPTIGPKGRGKRLIKEGDTFYGYFYKDWEHGQKVYVVYEPDKTTIVGWGIADRNDFVDPI